jgi:hypothetical protein
MVPRKKTIGLGRAQMGLAAQKMRSVERIAKRLVPGRRSSGRAASAGSLPARQDDIGAFAFRPNDLGVPGLPALQAGAVAHRREETVDKFVEKCRNLYTDKDLTGACKLGRRVQGAIKSLYFNELALSFGRTGAWPNA